MTIELKPAQFLHYPTIAKIHAQSWQKNYRNILSAQFLEEEVEKERKAGSKVERFTRHRQK